MQKASFYKILLKMGSLWSIVYTEWIKISLKFWRREDNNLSDKLSHQTKLLKKYPSISQYTASSQLKTCRRDLPKSLFNFKFQISNPILLSYKKQHLHQAQIKFPTLITHNFQKLHPVSTHHRPPIKSPQTLPEFPKNLKSNQRAV